MPAILNIAALVILLDQATKFLAAKFLEPVQSISVVPNLFHLSYVQNTGIAFGMFQNYPAAWSIIITVSICLLLIGVRFFKHEPFAKRMAYGFILGGAIGNWIDRIRLHHVIDFLDFRVWPVFNIADSFITVGVVLFIWFAMRGR